MVNRIESLNIPAGLGLLLGQGLALIIVSRAREKGVTITSLMRCCTALTPSRTLTPSTGAHRAQLCKGPEPAYIVSEFFRKL